MDVAEADRTAVSEGMGRSSLLSQNSLSFEGASSVLREALTYDHAINAKWNEESAVLATVNYTYASLMFERLIQMGAIHPPGVANAHSKVKNCQLRKEELSSMVDGAALREYSNSTVYNTPALDWSSLRQTISQSL